jgi:hypothetical protein
MRFRRASRQADVLARKPMTGPLSLPNRRIAVRFPGRPQSGQSLNIGTTRKKYSQTITGPARQPAASSASAIAISFVTVFQFRAVPEFFSARLSAGTSLERPMPSGK